MKEFITYLAQSLSQNPQEVLVNEGHGEKGATLYLTVSDDDLSHLIGKQGRTVKAMRTLLAVAGIKKGQRYFLQIASNKPALASTAEEPRNAPEPGGGES